MPEKKTHFYCQLDYEHVPYPSPVGAPNGNIANNGCGVCAASESAIVPVVVGDERRALAASEELERRGFLVPAIRYPTVARGSARLRFAVMSAHTRDQLSAAAEALASAVAK